jgi:hypothetical protein
VQRPRRGTHVIECAVVYPITFFLVLATFIGGMGIFRYQEIAYLTREAARYASTHGGQYAKEFNQQIVGGTLPTVSKSYIVNNVVDPQVTWMDTTKLNVNITFNTPNGSYDWDDVADNGGRWPNTGAVISGTSYSVTDTVVVVVSYDWYPEMFLAGPITLSSKSVMPMSY